MPTGIRPRVNGAHEFLEVAKDFKDPKELIREALSNSWDAGATIMPEATNKKNVLYFGDNPNDLSIFKGKTDHLLIHGDALSVLNGNQIPEGSIDCVVTSPPYWNLREYSVSAKNVEHLIGLEKDPDLYAIKLADIFSRVRVALKNTGSLWLNLGDTYRHKDLMGMPWRVAFELKRRGWILRNDIIWNQIKGTQSAKDRMRDVYEHIFHFVKSKKYYFDTDSIRIKPRLLAKEVKGRTISATGVSGDKYRKQIIESKVLTAQQKKNAIEALDGTLAKIRNGELVDFRMTIKGVQRTLHGDKGNYSGRAKELAVKGYFLLTSHAKGFLPSDIWNIVPEDKWRADDHYAVFPIELLEIPIKATCPVDGIVLDPFAGTCSTVAAAIQFGRRGIGIDVSDSYINTGRKRILNNHRKLL